MRLTIEKNQLLSTLAAVAKGMSSRSTMPILSGVLLTAEGGTLTLRTTDLETSVQSGVAALVLEEGEAVVPGRLLNEIVKSLPESSVSLDSADGGLTVSCADSSFRLNTLDPMDFPAFPALDVSRQVRIDAKDLQRMTRKAAKAVSRDESRPVLMGILMKIGGGRLTFVATDSYRLAVVEKSVEGDLDFELIVPGSVLEEVSRISAGEDVVTIAEGENQIVFTTGQTVFVSRKIEGNYPNYDVLIPKDKTISAVMRTADLLSAIRRVSIASQANGPVRLSFDPGAQRLTVSSRTQDVASGVETIDAQIEGEPLEIGFNHSYIIDGLGVIDSEEVLFENLGAMKSGVLRTGGEDDFLYLTMPLRIDA